MLMIFADYVGICLKILSQLLLTKFSKLSHFYQSKRLTPCCGTKAEKNIQIKIDIAIHA